jgi:hypothetical protein
VGGYDYWLSRVVVGLSVAWGVGVVGGRIARGAIVLSCDMQRLLLAFGEGGFG